MKPIPFLSLAPQHSKIRTEILEALAYVYDRNWFILGKGLESFEEQFAAFSSMPFCVGVGNGLDALFIALKSCQLGPGDEVIVPAHTFLATWLAVTRTGARLIPIEPDPQSFNIDTNKLSDAITGRTKAIVPVHLYGQSCNMTAIMEFTRSKDIFVIEDNAQAHGALWNGKITGSFGDAAATSFYPVKNLGALGDGGAIVTRNYDMAQYARRYRNYGFETKNYAEDEGVNSRLDEVQAAILNVKLKYIKEWNAERAIIANDYLKLLDGVGDLRLPVAAKEAYHAYHLFVIRTDRRDELREYLATRHIETAIHYPVPPHLQKSFAHLGFGKGDLPVTENIAETSLSLPLWPGMETSQVEYVCETIKNFFKHARRS